MVLKLAQQLSDSPQGPCSVETKEPTPLTKLTENDKKSILNL